jgi:hypothetical protein
MKKPRRKSMSRAVREIKRVVRESRPEPSRNEVKGLEVLAETREKLPNQGNDVNDSVGDCPVCGGGAFVGDVIVVASQINVVHLECYEEYEASL